MKSPAKWSLFLVPALLLAATLKADTLILRDGRRVEGQLISVRNGIVEFDEARNFGGGRTLRLDQNEVSGIQFDRNDRNTYSSDATSAVGRPPGMRERQIMVEAAMPWVDANINVQNGQNVYFQATGEVRWGPNRRHGPGGEPGSPVNANRPLPNRPAAALIGRVGDNSSDYFFIGNERGPIRMRSSGRLFLGVNDDVLQDNSGSFRVIVYY
jgi:hypothetical protein